MLESAWMMGSGTLEYILAFALHGILPFRWACAWVAFLVGRVLGFP